MQHKTVNVHKVSQSAARKRTTVYRLCLRPCSYGPIVMMLNLLQPMSTAPKST